MAHQQVYVNGKAVSLDPRKSVGQGGEAEVFDIGSGRVLKLFKQPDHPDFQGMPDIQKAVRERLAEHQQKLKEFPKGLPMGVVVPRDLVTDKTQSTVIGYTMDFIRNAEVLYRYSNRGFAQSISRQDVVTILCRLHALVKGIHSARVVIGDLNDLNVLVSGTDPIMIDADSFQFGRFLSKVFTERFVDPLSCTHHAGSGLMLSRPHTEMSDWYAFAIMLMLCQLYVEPYGGIHKPKNPSDKLKPWERKLQHVTVFHPDVAYPKPAIPFSVLPDGLLHELQEIFEKDKREEFPLRLLEEVEWKTCNTCGLAHARQTCPGCFKPAPASVVQKVEIRGKVMATRIFSTTGNIICATHQGGKLLWLTHERGSFTREDGTVVIKGPIDPHMRFRIQGKTTLIGRHGTIAILREGMPIEKIVADSIGLQTVFDANEYHRYWLDPGGRLLQDGAYGSEHIGDVPEGQTQFWVGSKNGCGFYRIGAATFAFTFRTEARGIDDSVKIPQIRGKLIDATCVFSGNISWLLVTFSHQGKTINRCMKIEGGACVATAEAEEGDGSWLSTIRGKGAAGDLLFCPTEDGMVCVKQQGATLGVSLAYPDTEPFIDSESRLFPMADGVGVVRQHDISILKLTKT